MIKRVVFCDFDGTITAEETFVALLKEFTPALSAELMPPMYARKLTLRQGVRQLLESIPASQYPAILEFSKRQVLRSGLPEFIDFLDANGVPFVVISGGVRGMVETVLGDLKARTAGIHAVDLDVSGEFCRVLAPDEDGTELVAKVKVMSTYDCDQQIAIGDSITDLNMALAAPVVFARDRLAAYLDERGKPYLKWDSFADIQAQLTKLWR
jgi:2-hydroxy-3-keto-5-methylthiopentenyl-1-phosphate phosphatase